MRNSFFILFIFQLFCFSTGYDFNITVDSLSLGNTKNIILNNSVFYLIVVQNISDIIERAPPRVLVKCENCQQNTPLLVIVTLNKGVLSWELPIVTDSSGYYPVYRKMERTLCPNDILNNLTSTDDREQEGEVFKQTLHQLTVSLSTSATLNIPVEVSINLEENFILHLNSNKSVQISPSTPAFYLYEFESENTTSVLLHVTSEDDICMTLSIQNVSCPVFDLEENVKYRGNFQTVSRQGAFTLTKDAFPLGFYAVLVVHNDDKYCTAELRKGTSERMKNVEMYLSKTISSDEDKVAVLITVAVIAAFCIVVYIIFYCLILREIQAVRNSEEELMVNDLEPSTSTQLPGLDPNLPVPMSPDGDKLSIQTNLSEEESDFDTAREPELDKNIRMKSYMHLCDLSRKNPGVLKKRSELYFSILVTVATFYFLPVFQLVFTDQYNQNRPGTEEQCYYNFLCSHPLWWFSDFNHVFSNIGYISFGILFVLIVMLKEKVYNTEIRSNSKYRCRGVLPHFGLFYAMAAALIIEGILSSCYHFCPNNYNFQFDTSFMYVICTLCMIKIYQTRHPDITANASSTFALLAAIIALRTYGVFNYNLTFWILFTILHLSMCIYISLKIYYLGRFKLGFRSVLRWLKEFQPFCCSNWRSFMPVFPSRFALLILGNICNWALAVGGFFFGIKNFSEYLLTIFMMNLMLYTAFYILMKFICRERLPCQSVVYILLAMVCWSVALYFFFSKTISWMLTPAESKLYNQKCNLFNFYDNHDIWHFISAAAMFFSFMVLLTIDNDLICVHRSKIVVF